MMAATKNISAASEITPLLAASDAGPTAQNHEDSLITSVSNSTSIFSPDPEMISDDTLIPDDGSSDQPQNGSNGAGEGGSDKPLPKTQIFLLCFARMIEPMAFFGVFPFVNQMIEDTGGLAEAKVGFYSGLIESMFSLTQMLLMIQWGRAADRLGRKPVLVFSLAGVSVATAAFGFSKQLWQMFFFRCSAGVFAGTIVTIRTMLTENSTPKTQARAFSFFSFGGNVGIFLGGLLGGVLQNPAEQYGSIFEKVGFFKKFPYALPTITNGVIAAIATVVCALFVKETLKRKDKSSTGEIPKPPMSTWEIFKSPGIPFVLFLYGHVMLLGLAYTAVTPLFWFTSVKLGGYGFTPIQISAFFSVVGVSQAIWLLLIFPPLQHKFGTVGVLRACLYAWPFFFFMCPVGNWLLRNDYTTVFWIIAPICQITGSGVSMAFTCVQLVLNDNSPSDETLGTLNALALAFVSGIRAVAPTLFTSLFAIGVSTQVLDGYLAWAAMVALSLLGSVSVRWLPEKVVDQE